MKYTVRKAGNKYMVKETNTVTHASITNWYDNLDDAFEFLRTRLG